MIDHSRGTGRTTRQMKAAPVNAVYIWCNRFVECAKQMARDLDRTDLQIVSPEWIDSERWRGQTFSGVVVDHATALTSEQWERWRWIQAQVRAWAF